MWWRYRGSTIRGNITETVGRSMIESTWGGFFPLKRVCSFTLTRITEEARRWRPRNHIDRYQQCSRYHSCCSNGMHRRSFAGCRNVHLRGGRSIRHQQTVALEHSPYSWPLWHIELVRRYVRLKRVDIRTGISRLPQQPYPVWSWV